MYFVVAKRCDEFITDDISAMFRDLHSRTITVVKMDTCRIVFVPVALVFRVAFFTVIVEIRHTTRIEREMP